MLALKQSLYFFSRYGVTLTFLFALAGIAAEMLNINLISQIDASNHWAITMSSLISTAIFEPIATGAAIYFIASRDKGENLNVYESVKKSCLTYGNLFTCYLISTLMVLFGLSLYVIPGVFFLYKLFFAEYFIVMHEDDPMEAIQHSFERTQGRTATLLPAFGIILMILMASHLLISSMVESLGGDYGIRMLGALLEAPLLAFIIVVGFRLFSLTTKSKSGV